MYRLLVALSKTVLVKETENALFIVDHNYDFGTLQKGSFKFNKIFPGGKWEIRLFQYNDEVLIYADQKIFLADDKNEIRIALNDLGSLEPIIVWKRNLILGGVRDGKIIRVLMDLSGHLLWKKNISMTNSMLLHDDHLFFSINDENMNSVNHIIHRMYLPTGESKQLIDFSSCFNSSTLDDGLDSIGYYFLTHHDNTLICLLNRYGIVGIDPDNGIIKWAITEWMDETGKEVNCNFTGPWQGGVYNNKFYLLQGHVFACLYIEERKFVLERDVENCLKKEKLFITRSCVFNDKIYFTAEDDNTGKWNCLGVFDIETQKVVWQTTIDLPKGEHLALAPVVDDSYIYLMAGINTLHIFEKVVE
jgi:outer membrane protein assembly factor BamB